MSFSFNPFTGNLDIIRSASWLNARYLTLAAPNQTVTQRPFFSTGLRGQLFDNQATPRLSFDPNARIFYGPTGSSPQLNLSLQGAAVIGNNQTPVAGSMFLCANAGTNATAAINSFMFGAGAGFNATNALESFFGGFNAGATATNAYKAINIGSYTGYGVTYGNHMTNIGERAGFADTVDNASFGTINAISPTPTNGGYGYTVNDILTVINGSYGVGGQVKVTAVNPVGFIYSASINNQGSGYIYGDYVTVSGGDENSTVMAQPSLEYGGINGWSLVNGGTGYFYGDGLTTGNASVYYGDFYVDGVDGNPGEPTAVSVSDGGINYLTGDILTLDGGDSYHQVLVDSTDGLPGTVSSDSLGSSGGTDYVVGELFYVNGGSTFDHVLEVTSIDGTAGEVVSSSLVAPGTGYSPTDVLTAAGGNGDFTIEVDSVGGSGEISTWHVLTTGSGYYVSNYALTGGSGSNAGIDIDSIYYGIVTGYTIATTGDGYSVGADQGTTSSTGFGSGCLINIDSTYGGTITAISTYQYGLYYAVGTYATTGGSGTGALINVDSITYGEITSLSLTYPGANHTASTNYPLFYYSGSYSGSGAEINVSSVHPGYCDGIQLIDGGSGYSNATGASTITQFGNGSGLTLDILAGNSVTNLIKQASGSGYPVRSGLATSGGTGTGCTVQIQSINSGQEGYSLNLGRFSKTGGFRNTNSIGRGVMCNKDNQMTLGNILRIDGIYNSDTPSATLQSGGIITAYGGRVGKVTTVTNSYVALVSDDLIVCNRSTALTITLPTAVVGQTFFIKNINTGTVTVDGASSDTIDGELTQEVDQWETLLIRCYAANKWGIL